MNTKQISVFLENKKGRLAEVTKLLTDEAINMRALSLADGAEFGVLRLIVNDPDRCLRVLRDHDLAAQETEVVAVEIDDKPGSLHRIVDLLDREDINIEYMYAFLEKKGPCAIGVFKIDDEARAVDVLGKNGISVLTEDMIENL